MDISVIIPTYRRPRKLAACLEHLARQTLAPDRFEVLVGLDGPDPESESIARASRAPVQAVACPREGLNATRNRVLARATGRYLVSLNDDILAEPQLLEVHLREQRLAESRGQAAIISGDAPWRVFENDTLFDRLVRETSMLFFYDRMQDADPAKDWGFRHCWGLNFSAPLEMVRALGGFVAIPLAYGYDDIELAFRLQQRYRTPVLFRPDARGLHDHRYQPREVLSRERKLGFAAWHFAESNPAFARAVFNRDILSEEELEYSRQFVQRERATAERLEESFVALGTIPSADIAGPHAPTLIRTLYEQHLLLKRWYWRTGLLEAADAESRSSSPEPLSATAR